MPGALALILHAHLPFVRHPEHEHFLEEDWLFEAITETYIPLLQIMQRLVNDHVPFKITCSLTPTLCAMLQDELLRERYVRHIDLVIDLARREQHRNRADPKLLQLARFYHALFLESRRFFVDQCRCDLLGAFRELREIGVLEIIASAATHGILPLIHQQSRQAARAQVLIGRDAYVNHFGAQPIGFWLPECAYAPELAVILQEADIRWFVLDAHGLLLGKPCPLRSIYAPCFTPAGPAAFARDSDSSRQIWSAQAGYPGDPAYRDFYRDAGFDLSIEQLGLIARGVRKFSGLKYHRITGMQAQKELYDPVVAENVAENHAAHFLEQRREQIREISAAKVDPIIAMPFDAELFGHWWFEGPKFLEALIRKIANEPEFLLTTPAEYLAANPTQQIVEPTESTWGENGYFEVWLNEKNSWIYPYLYEAARRMNESARKYASETTSPLADRVLKQLARELLLAQSSDWAFLMKTGTARAYATKRTKEHLVRFNQLYDQFRAKSIDETFLRECESRDNLFSDLNWRYYV